MSITVRVLALAQAGLDRIQAVYCLICCLFFGGGCAERPIVMTRVRFSPAFGGLSVVMCLKRSDNIPCVKRITV